MTIKPMSANAMPTVGPAKGPYVMPSLYPGKLSGQLVSTPVPGFSSIAPEIPDPVERTIRDLMDGVSRFCCSTHRFDKGLEYALAALDRAQRLEERRSNHSLPPQRSVEPVLPIAVQHNSVKPRVTKNEATS